MKTKILFFLLLSVNILHAQYTLIPDTNFEQALINQGIDTENILDGKVLTTDINSIEVLNINHQSINSLGGIEDFTMLKELYCIGNGLETIDMSSNLLLEILEASENYSISSINITQNTMLHTFILSCPGMGFDGLTSIDFSNNTSLKIIDVAVALENIDVSNNLLLETLSCSNNQLTSLDVSNNVNLKVLDFADYLIDYGNSNNINSIDLSNNPNLEILNCSNNLNVLDLSHNQNLHTLVAQATGITSLDLSLNPNLTYINLLPNYYPPDEGVGHLTEINIRNGHNDIITYFDATNNPDLTCIYVDDKEADCLNDWSIDDITSFVETEAECTVVTIGDYSLNSISIYPNPTTGTVSINTPNNAVKEVIIYNQLRQQVGVYYTNTFNISNLINGVYIAKTRNNVNEIFISKIIKK